MAKPSAPARLNKAQLIARINELEHEVDGLYVSQRPSRQWPLGESPRAAAQAAQRRIPPGFAAARELAMRTGRSVKVA